MKLTQAELTASVDAGSYKDGIKQSSGAWTELGTDGKTAWGAIKGSAREPYFVCIDLNDPKLPSKCTCPSRKFPCKHAVGLALKAIADLGGFPTAEPPESVKTWSANREKRAKKSDDAPATPEKAAAKAKSQKKTADARASKVAAGMADLQLRLRDIVRQGLTDDRWYRYATWDEMARRMVDAQAGGVASRLRSLGSLTAVRTKLQTDASPFLDELARLYLLAECYNRIDSYPDDVQADIRAMIGFTLKQDEVAASGERVRDIWLVLGQEFDTLPNGVLRTVWLRGLETERWACLIDFQPQFGGRSAARFDSVHVAGELIGAEMVFYPGAFPQRALIAERIPFDMAKVNPAKLVACFEHPHLKSALDAYANALAKNPFLERYPFSFSHVTPVHGEKGELLLIDGDQAFIPLASGKVREMIFMAASGGDTISIFGTWNGYGLRLITLFADGVMVSLD